MKKILFVCIENSCRSQMAEAFARIHGMRKVEAFSAGSNPSGKINAKAIEVMAELGYDLSTHKSKPVHEILKTFPLGKGLSGHFDYVITMGCGDNCPIIPAKYREDWQLPDPENLQLEEFRKIRDEIAEKVKTLIAKT